MYAEGEPQMLPEALRQAVRAALSGQVLSCCDDVGDRISCARRRRDAGVRASLAAAAAGFTFSTAQASRVLTCLSYSQQNQVPTCSLLCQPLMHDVSACAHALRPAPAHSGDALVHTFTAVS